MKTFLNVMGLVALIGSLFNILTGTYSKYGIEATLSGLIIVTCFGLAKIIELQEKAAEKSEMRDKAAREHYATMASFGSPASGSTSGGNSALPPVPGKEEYFISDGERAVGPYKADKIQALAAKGTINKDTYILKQGAKEWQRLGDVFRI